MATQIKTNQIANSAVTSAKMETNVWHLVGGAGEPAFQNSWSNYGGGYATAAFMLDKEGIVHLRGLIAGTTNATVIFTLPVGYRPGFSHLYIISASEVAARLDIASSGNVAFSSGTKTYVTLENVCFGVGA